MKHINTPAPGNNGDVNYADTVSSAMGISEARNEELHNSLLDEVDKMQKGGEPLTAAGLLKRVVNITETPAEAAYMGFAVCKSLDAMHNPMAALLASLGKGEEEPA